MPTRQKFQNPRRPQRPRNQRWLLAFGLVGLLCFWGMKAQMRPSLDWITVPPHSLATLPTQSLAQSPDPLKLLDLPERYEDKAMRNTLLQVLQRTPGQLKPHLYYLNLKTGAYVNLEADAPVPAASVIKLPVLMDYFRAMGEGKFKATDPLYYDFIHQAGGSGDLQYRPPGFNLPSLQVAKTMIQISDNTATNMLVDNLGGMKELNERFQRMGLAHTSMGNWLPDLGGTNKIATRDMAKLLYNINYSDFLCFPCRQVAMRILEGVHNNRLIPAGLPPEVIVAHKTGDIGTSLGDSALVIPPNNDSYLLSIQVERPYNDGTAKPLIIELSRSVYQHQQLSSSLAAKPGT